MCRAVHFPRVASMTVPYWVERLHWWYFNAFHCLGVLLTPTHSAAQVDAHIGRIRGTSPQPNAEGVIFFAANDAFMERYGFNLILSCHKHAPEFGVHAHLFEPAPAVLRQLEFIKQEVGDLLLSYTYEERLDLGRLPDPGMYYTAFRFLAAHKILQESNSLVICLDADSLMMSSPCQFASEARRHDVGLYFRLRKRRLNKKIAAFCVVLNCTAGSHAFLQLLSSLVMKSRQHYRSNRSNFHFDQSGLYFAYLATRLTRRATFHRIGHRAVDYNFDAAACIWTAKGKRKNDPVFERASRRVREWYPYLTAPLERPG